MSSSNARVLESSAMLLAFSFFALVEGTIRMVANSKPSVDVDYWDNAGGTIIPVGVLLMAGAGEVVFGIFGIYVAIFSLLLNKNSPVWTKAFLIVQAILGWFVFLTYVIAAPIIKAKEATGNDLLSQAEQKSLIILGNMLGSICFCWAMQGGQFIMGMRLLAAQTDEEEIKAKNAWRARIWAGNVLAAAFSTLFVGSMLASKGFSSNKAPIGLPPHVVWYPSISIITGVIMLAFGVLAWIAPKCESKNRCMPMAWLVTTTAMMINFSWTFGIVPGLAPPIPGSAQHLGLVLSVTLLPLLHSHKSHHLIGEREGETDESDEMKEVTDASGEMKEEPLKVEVGEDLP